MVISCCWKLTVPLVWRQLYLFGSAKQIQTNCQPMKKLVVGVTCGLLCLSAFPLLAANYQLLGWNNLGMHCMDSDYSVFSILPPYNTIQAQLIVGGKLVTNGTGSWVSYQAVADPDGSINRSSVGKGNWLEFAPLLYGNVAADQGLPFPGPDSFWMPGSSNLPQSMLFDAGLDWFYAYGVPITPYDDAGQKNPYPMMRLIARLGNGTPIATNDIVLPVSDEMDCRACHASGTQHAAKPSAGWVWAANQERDFRLNILRLHDERNFAEHNGLYVAALATRGFNPQGLYRSVVADGKPVLCAVCHASEALGAGSYSNIPPLTASIHMKHAAVLDPELGIPLNNAAHRDACYRCHPGSVTKCLRGAMGGAIASDGTMAMQCQSCHGSMSHVGRAGRTGWLEEPNCQQCHTGTATSNNGQIRYTSCFTDTTAWAERIAVNQTFATQSNTPASGISLYRFSAGHGGLQCAACHGSTHAEFPATHKNDNVRNEKIQGHSGVMIECTACHTSMPVNSTTARGGPHGMHPVGQAWVDGHHDYVGGLANCQVCHGTDYRGTPLSRAQTSRAITVNRDGIIVQFPTYKGAEIGCYNCHNGPTQSSPNTSALPVASNFSTNTLNDRVLTFALPVSGAGAVARVLSQPANGTVGISNNMAAYFPAPGFVGTETFTFAAYNGSKNSLLATGTVTVAQGAFSLRAAAHVPATWPAGWPAPFNAVPAPSNSVGELTFDWNFGDGSAHAPRQFATHSFVAPGSYNWTMISTLTASAGIARATNTGTIVVTVPSTLAMAPSGSGSVTLTWPLPGGDALLEETLSFNPTHWSVVTNGVPVNAGGSMSVVVPLDAHEKFYRLRQL